MNIQWYPGHMTKARREMQESMKLIDMIIELVDARLPMSSRNPDIHKLGQNKYRMLILNKYDLADEGKTAAWDRYFTGQGYHVVYLDSRSSAGMKKVENTILAACAEKLERDRRRGIQNRPIRAMVAGIPNVGKSTFINSMAKKSAARTGNKPGVTKGNQWIRLNRTVELMDTPGILWPKFEDEAVGFRLALTGSINDQVLNLTELAARGIETMAAAYPGRITARYEGLSVPETADPYVVLEQIAVVRGALKKGGEGDPEKAARLFLDDLRAGRLGRITLEEPEAQGAQTDPPQQSADQTALLTEGKLITEGEDSHGSKTYPGE